MTVPLFPFGYARPPDGGPQGMGTMLSWEGMLAKTTVNRLHPEVLRRFHALIDLAYTAGVPLGCGTGWRTQPDPPPAGFAKPGNSWHESCPVSPTSSSALAIDTVPNVSWDWMQIHSGRYGLRSFRYVNNEPWHVQPVEISTSRRYATVLPALVKWDLPGDEQPPPTPPALEEDDMTMLLRCSGGTMSGAIAVAPDDLSRMLFLSSGADYDALAATGRYGTATLSAATFERIPGAEQIDVLE